MPSQPTAALPVSSVLPRVIAALRDAGAAVLVAPPGAGKTTMVPLELTRHVDGRIIVAQPRRVAARAAARRMAALLGEPVGATVGYAVRGERRTSRDTRIEVVTTGLLVQRLHHDPELAGTAAVLLDECHERHLDGDLALAFTVDVRATLRPDLWLLAMSATPQTDRMAAVLGAPGAADGLRLNGSPGADDGGGASRACPGRSGADTRPAPVITADAATHPVEVVWTPPPGPVDPPHGLRVDPRLLDHVADTVRRALGETTGDVLVFLPGVGEIRAVSDRLAALRDSVDVLPLHGRLASREQDAALRAGAANGGGDAPPTIGRPRPDGAASRRRVVLATAVAETSLTVPGVRVVVDAGLSRLVRTDLARGLDALVTVAVSRAAAAQRAGRAGREGPGRVYRCWSTAAHDRLPERPEPEITTADLTGFALHLAAWGHPDGSGLALPDPPPDAALRVARSTLAALGAVGPDGRVTARGRLMVGVGIHPRLARALLDGAPVVGRERAAEVVALLAEEFPGGGDDLAAAWRLLRAGGDPVATGRWRDEVRRLRSALPAPTGAALSGAGGTGQAATRPGHPASGHPRIVGDTRSDPSPRALPDDLAVGLLVGLAYPERLARLRRPGGTTYLMAGGTAAELAAGTTLAGATWLAVAAADRPTGHSGARIRRAAAIDEATAVEAGAPLLSDEQEIGWDGTDVVARQVRRLGALVLVERPVPDPDPALLAAALRQGLAEVGLSLLSWTDAARALRARLAFCHAALGEPWPDVSDAGLLAAIDTWLGPDLATARRRADLRRIDLTTALRRLLPWPQAARLDELAPERITVPSGSRIRVDYADPAAPVLAVRLQETFGWRDAPRIAAGSVPVLLHLLSPAGRPVAVTRDLASFWRSGYHQVRAELRGRYPRHPWPEDPTSATPTRRAQPRAR